MESNQRLGDGNSATSGEVPTDNLYYFYTQPEFIITVSYFPTLSQVEEAYFKCVYVVSFHYILNPGARLYVSSY